MLPKAVLKQTGWLELTLLAPLRANIMHSCLADVFRLQLSQSLPAAKLRFVLSNPKTTMG